MKIHKTLLKNIMGKSLYTYPDNTTAGDENFKLSFSVSQLKEERPEEFGGDTLSGYHVFLEGRGRCSYSDGRSFEMESLKVRSCEEGERLCVTGCGCLFHMVMDGGVRGFIRTFKPEKMVSMRIGEGVGGCVMAFLGIDGGFRMEAGEEILFCEKGEILFLEMKQKEFSQLKLWPEREGMEILSANGVLLSPYDFGKYIGVRFSGTGRRGVQSQTRYTSGAYESHRNRPWRVFIYAGGCDLRHCGIIYRRCLYYGKQQHSVFKCGILSEIFDC